MRWWMKAALQYGFARLPLGQSIYRKIQTHTGEISRLEKSTRFRNAISLLKQTRLHLGPIENRHVVELGTGWVPAVPLAFTLAGARVDTFDVQQLIDRKLFQRTVARLEQLLPEVIVAADADENLTQERIQRLASQTNLESALREFGGSFRAPFNTTQLPYEVGSVDAVVSSLVLQCIPATVLPNVLRESFRVLKPGGTAIHRMYLADELAGSDPKRNHLSYLQYSDATWHRYFTSSLTHLNRWRFSQFTSLFKELGFELCEAEKEIDWASIPHLKKLAVAPEFQGLAWEDLATVSCTVVLRKPVQKSSAKEAESATEQSCPLVQV